MYSEQTSSEFESESSYERSEPETVLIGKNLWSEKYNCAWSNEYIIEEPPTTDEEESPDTEGIKTHAVREYKSQSKRVQNKSKIQKRETRACTYKREREPERQEKVALLSGTTDRGAKLKGKMRWSQKHSGNSTSRRKEVVMSDDPNFQPENYMFEGEDNMEQQAIQKAKSERKAIQLAKQPKTKQTNISRDKPKGKTRNKRDSRITNNNFTGLLIGAISIEPYIETMHSAEPIKKEDQTPYPGESGGATRVDSGGIPTIAWSPRGPATNKRKAGRTRKNRPGETLIKFVDPNTRLHKRTDQGRTRHLTETTEASTKDLE